MRATFEDFTSKYGFRDGAATEERDFRVRQLFIARFNAEAGEHYIAVDWDRPGMHNGCMLLFFDKNQWWSKPDEYLERWACGKITAADPVVVANRYPVDDMIEDLYRETDDVR